PLDPKQAAAAVAAIPDQIKKLRQRVAKPAREKETKEKKGDNEEKPATQDRIHVAPVLARRAALAVEDVRRTLKDWAAFYDGFVPEFGWWLKKPNAETQTALEGYAKFLREEIAGLKGEDEDPLVGDPIGAKALVADLAAEMVAY